MTLPRAPGAHGQLQAAARDLIGTLPAGRVLMDQDAMEAFRNDQAELVTGGLPMAVARPHDTAEVQAVMRVAGAHGVPVVPRGAGSGLSGGAAAIDGCIVLSTEAMTRILEVDGASLLARAEAGVLNGALAAEAARHGLWYAPDPASRDFSTIGGNIATNAGGLCCVKYGVTRESVLGLTAVTASGEILEVGGRTVKRVAGLDLLSLLVGSEGTLAVVTEATLRLRPVPPAPLTGAAYFPTLVAAGRAVAAIAEARIAPSMLELIDRATMTAVERWRRLDLDLESAALLLFQSDLPGDARLRELERAAACCEQAGANLVVTADDEADSAMLMEVRRLCFPALEHRGGTLLEDVGVPIARVPDLLARCEEISREIGLTVATFGHAGDGNMHPTVVFDRHSAEERERALGAAGLIFEAALALGGTITGEHGVGLLKRPWLESDIGPVARRIGRGIKHAFDPQGILNPGKAI
ncbi:MAG: FAD-binding oxidoreductase [Thermoleophilia bacterium]